MTPLSTKEVQVEPTIIEDAKEAGLLDGTDHVKPLWFKPWHEAITKFAQLREARAIAAAPTASEKAEPVGEVTMSAVYPEDSGPHKGKYLHEFYCDTRLPVQAELYADAPSTISLTNKQDTSAEQGEPVLSKGSWRHNQGMLFSGTLRVARADFDTAPSEKVRDEILQNICDAMNTSPPSADAMFNRAMALEAGIRQHKVFTDQYECASSQDKELYELLSAPTDMVVMSREELEAFAEKVYELAPSIFELDTVEEAKGVLRDLVSKAIVSRVKEGE
jgi:hypothetical protein